MPENGLLALEVAWKRPLGSGYSSISVADGRGVTLFSDGDSDFVIAFDAATGAELWRHRIGEVYKGHDGSSDGPLSTPAIFDGSVFAVGPRGELLALRLDGGSVIWSQRLIDASDPRAPQYGHATSPLVVDDPSAGHLVIVQACGDGRSITAFDPVAGEIRWTAADDTASYQSPVAMDLLGHRQIVAAGDHFLFGLEPASGEVLWKTRHTEDGKANGASGLPVRLTESSFLMRPSPDDIGLWEMREDDDDYAVEERWRERLLKRSHAAPIVHEGYIYSFDSNFLTCLDARTGQRAWKSRPPGGRGLILVDGYLVTLGAKGHLVVAEASPEGYREVARLAVLGSDGWTPPSFADGVVYVRNLEEMAAVRIVAAAPDTATGPAAGALGLAGLAEASTPAAGAEELEEILGDRDSLHWIGDNGLVHFVFRGEHEDVALSGNFTEDFGEEVAMERIPGSDVFVRSFQLDPASHYEYRFHLDFGAAAADASNPHPIGSGFGPSSELRMPGWTVPAHLDPPSDGSPRGRLEAATLESALLETEVAIRVYLPPGYDDSGANYPLLVVQESAGGETARMEDTLDSLIGKTVEPLVAVFLPPRQREHDVEDLDRWARMIHEDLVPWVEQRYRVRSRERVLLGAGTGAPIAVATAFHRPGTFSALAVQSFYLRGLFGKIGIGTFSMTPALQDEILALAGNSDRQELEIYLEWSAHETRDPSSGIDAAADLDRLRAALDAAGYDYRTNEVPGRPGYG
ncbi:MAG: PQQ-binding-like beta-propeller repeat protein, partial [Thermoanaerobaculia bacterium]